MPEAKSKLSKPQKAAILLMALPPQVGDRQRIYRRIQSNILHNLRYGHYGIVQKVNGIEYYLSTLVLAMLASSDKGNSLRIFS